MNTYSVIVEPAIQGSYQFYFGADSPEKALRAAEAFCSFHFANVVKGPYLCKNPLEGFNQILLAIQNQGWNKMEDKLPPEHELVIAYNGRHATIARYVSNGFPHDCKYWKLLTLPTV